MVRNKGLSIVERPFRQTRHGLKELQGSQPLPAFLTSTDGRTEENYILRFRFEFPNIELVISCS